MLDLSEVTIVSGNADFTTTGEKIFRIEYYGKQYEISLKIFDPDITVIDLVIIYNFNDPIIPLGADVGEIIAELLVGKEAYASYYMMIDENWGENFTVTADMIDWSQVDGEVEGFYYITLTYKGYVKEIEVIIMGMAEGDPIAIYTGFCSAFPETFHKMELYPNGYALLYMSPDDGISYWLIPISVAYEQEGATMTLKIFGEPLCILTIDEEAGTFEPYNLDGEELYAIYTADAGEEGILTVYAYENGFGYFEMGGMPVYFGYHIEDDKFILHPTYVGIVFRIEGDTLVPYDE